MMLMMKKMMTLMKETAKHKQFEPVKERHSEDTQLPLPEFI
jgi:hypothetical protein